jgi:hypothetical protein
MDVIRVSDMERERDRNRVREKDRDSNRNRDRYRGGDGDRDRMETGTGTGTGWGQGQGLGRGHTSLHPLILDFAACELSWCTPSRFVPLQVCSGLGGGGLVVEWRWASGLGEGGEHLYSTRFHTGPS